jgi:hypothetical protein
MIDGRSGEIKPPGVSARGARKHDFGLFSPRNRDVPADHFVLNLWTVNCSYSSPGFSPVVGNAGWFGESG